MAAMNHMVVEMSKGVVTAKCGKVFTNCDDHFGTTFAKNVTCKPCLKIVKEDRAKVDAYNQRIADLEAKRLLGVTQKEVVNDEDIEW